jgi:hypothetical protein
MTKGGRSDMHIGERWRRIFQRISLKYYRIRSIIDLGASRTWRNEGALMTALQAFLLGLMAAWTPCLLLLAWLLPYRPITDSEDQPSDLP